MFRRLTRGQLVADLVVAVLCLLLRLAIGTNSPALFAVVVLMAASLALWRWSPGLGLAIAWVGAILQMISLQNPDASNLAILAVLYGTARFGEPRVKWAGLISAGVGSLVASLYMTFWVFGGDPWYVGPGQGTQLMFIFGAWLVGMSAALGLSWTLGLLVRTWRTARDAQRARVEAQHTVVIEQERNRIARDMHDVVAHSLAVVIAQADGARYARATDPEAVDAALTTIASTAREALADVRVLLGQLRHSQDQGPQPVIGDLSSLFDQMRTSGLDVRVQESGTAVVLPASQQLAVYRICQESLVNALRHGSAAAPVLVELKWSGALVELTVSSGLRGGVRAEQRSGHGITGMRERALLVGGTFAAGVEGEQFVVRASVPFGAEVAA